MFFKYATVLTLCAAATAQLSLVYQFPNTSYTNIENVALRSCKGTLLLSIATGPSLVELDPSYPVPNYLTTLSGPGSLTGIAETSSDVFTVAAGNFSFGSQIPGGVAGITGTFGVWSIDLNASPAKASLITAIPAANTLNGLVYLPYTNYVLIADSGLGAIWRVNVKTGESVGLISDPTFAKTAFVSLGINGLKYRKGVLYFTNSAQGTYGSLPIDPKTGAATGSVSIIAHAPAPIVNGTNSSFDDFVLDKKGNAYVATPSNAVSYVTQAGAVIQYAGPPKQNPALVSPTSAVLKGCDLYVVTGGSAMPPGLVSGQVLVGNVCQWDD